MLPPGVNAEQIRFWEDALRRCRRTKDWMAWWRSRATSRCSAATSIRTATCRSELEGHPGAGGRAGTGREMSTPHSFEPSRRMGRRTGRTATSPQPGLAMGGPEALAKFKASGRMNARERIAALPTTAASTNGRAGRQGPLQPRRPFERIDPTNAIVGTAPHRRAQGGAARGRLHHPRRLVRRHHRRQVDLHRTPGAPVAHAAGAAGGFGRRQRQAADADRRHQDPRVPQLAGQRAAEDRAGGRRGAGRLRRAGRDQGAVVALSR
jgi:hypothetical protein